MNGTTSTAWSPQSWRQKPVVQDVVYPTPAPLADGAEQPDPVSYKRKQALDDVVSKLEKLPPIVSPTEVRCSTRDDGVTSLSSRNEKICGPPSELGSLKRPRLTMRMIIMTDRATEGKAGRCSAREGVLAAGRRLRR